MERMDQGITDFRREMVERAEASEGGSVRGLSSKPDAQVALEKIDKIERMVREHAVPGPKADRHEAKVVDGKPIGKIRSDRDLRSVEEAAPGGI